MQKIVPHLWYDKEAKEAALAFFRLTSLRAVSTWIWA
ncbi:hypothetical protein AusDCA_0688 [Desulfitobacterium sp. AusDCA]